MRDNKKRRHSAVRLMRILYHKLHRNAIFKISHIKTLPVFMRRIKTPLRRRGIILAGPSGRFPNYLPVGCAEIGGKLEFSFAIGGIIPSFC